jgi:hypothetical protein
MHSRLGRWTSGSGCIVYGLACHVGLYIRLSPRRLSLFSKWFERFCSCRSLLFRFVLLSIWSLGYTGHYRLDQHCQLLIGPSKYSAYCPGLSTFF